MIESLAAHRPGIIAALERIDQADGPGLSAVNRWATDLRSRLLVFTSRGKLIRGALVAATADALGRAADAATYEVAAAVELVQSFLLVHDDIMDEDPIRRGSPAIYEQYRRYGSENGFRDSARFGESMGICGGDVAVLKAIAALTRIDTKAETRTRLIELLSTEIARVGVAQMADVANGHSPSGATEEEILSVYRYKTGRYTFSVPMMLGAILAGAGEGVVETLSAWGELQGVIFQIRDDHLGIMGDTNEIGKPSATDISSNKQTLHRLHLLERLPGTEWVDVGGYFGHDHLSHGQIDRVRRALEGTGTLDLLGARIDSLRNQANVLLNGLDLPASARCAFSAIDAYNAERAV